MICCVTGHRSKGFPFSHDDYCMEYMIYQYVLHNEVERLLREDYRDFVCGMAEGADLDFAQAVMYYRSAEGSISLEAALPYPIRPSKRITKYSDNRDDILCGCDRITIVSPYYHKGCMQKRNQYMVDKSDLVLAIWNSEHSGGTWNTIHYALSKGKTVRYIMLNEVIKQLPRIKYKHDPYTEK